MNPFDPYGPMETTTLEWLKVAVRQHVSDGFAETVELKTWRDEILGHIVFELRARVLAESLPPESVTDTKTVTWSVPDSWWDHFKLTHGHRWWLRWHTGRHPARMDERPKSVTLTVDLRRFHTYPEAKRLNVADFGRPVRVAMVDTTWRVS